jgi:hypothetical protein
MTKRRRKRPAGGPAGVAAAAAAPDTPAPAPSGVLAWAYAACVALTLVSYAADLPRGFSNDDYRFLDRSLWTPLSRLFDPAGALVGWFRPWSRELHFWLLTRAFGPEPFVFHAANLLLWLGTLALLARLLRGIAGERAAALALLGAFATSAWGLYPVWASASQDLWLLLFGCAFLIAFRARRTALASASLLMAFLSKETALLLLPLAWWFDLARPRPERNGRAMIAALAGVALLWLLVHPSLGGRWWFGSGVRITAAEPGAFGLAHLRGLLAVVNLDRSPDLRGLGPLRLLECAAWAAGLGAAAWLALSRQGAARPDPRLLRVGLGWWAILWLPFLVPTLRWHAYYGWLGLCGAWLAIAAVAASRPRALLALLVAVAALRPIAARTWDDDWSHEQYQRVAAGKLTRLRAALAEREPSPPRHTRMFFAALPGGTGFRSDPRSSAALRVWYRDPTLVGGVFSDYVPRTAADSLGPDHFYVVSGDTLLLPLAGTPGCDDPALRKQPLWRIAEEQITNQFADHEEWQRAMNGYARLEAAWPDTARHAFNLGVAWARLGREDMAERWLDRADSLAGSPPRAGRGYLARFGGS